MLVTRNKQYILSFKKWIHKSELLFFSRWNTYSCLFIIQSYSMYNIHMYLPAISSCINAKWGLSRLYSSLRKIGAEIPFTFHPLALGLFFWKLSSFFLCYGCQHQFARLRSTLYTVYLVWSENDLHLHTSSDICMYRLQVLDYRGKLGTEKCPDNQILL